MEKLKNERVNRIIVILTFIFNILIFGPTEIYYTNKNELWFEINDFLPIAIFFAMALFVILYLIATLLKSKKRDVFLRIIFALSLGLYIQGNFLNFGYKSLDGEKTVWRTTIIKGGINICIWILLISIPYCIKKLNKNNNFKAFTTITSFAILLIEIITLLTLGITQEKEEKFTAGLNNQDIFNLSKKENIIVFMSDTFEATYMNQILEEYPEYKEKLQDFTYFDNCTGVSFFTYSSMPTLLTGVECQVGNNLQENLDYCFDNTIMYDVLRENGYNTEIYVENALEPRNAKIYNQGEANKTTSFQTKIKVTEKMYKYTLYRYLPHFLKFKFELSSDEFNKIKSENSALQYKEKTYYMDDVAFNKDLTEYGITTKSNKKVFKFYETNGMHIPYDTTVDLTYDNSKEYLSLKEEQRRYNEGIASLNLLCNYIEELKKAGVYENTTIIFMADHGYNNRFYTTLLVKKARDKHDFEISSAPVTLLEDLVPTILNIATNSKDYGKDFFDYSEDDTRIRQVYDYTYDTNNIKREKNVLKRRSYTVISKLIFQTEGKASDENSFYLVDEEYSNANKELTEEYEFGEVVNIKDINEKNSINLTGFTLESLNFKVSEGCNISRNATLTVKRKNTNTDVKAIFKIKEVYDTDQTINFKINGETIYTCVRSQSSTQDITFTIPKEIWNKNDKLELEIEFPDAKLGTQYATMMMAIKLDSIQFTN